MAALKVIGANSIVTIYLTGVTALKEMTVTIVSSVEGHGISSKDSSHYRRYGYCACTKEEVDMLAIRASHNKLSRSPLEYSRCGR